MEKSKFDRDRGVDTDGTIHLMEFENIDPELAKVGMPYQPTSPAVVSDAMAFFNEEPKNFDFIDFGSGKGRILIGAAEQGFRSVTGVEFVPELVDIAQANLAALGISGVHIHQGDAARFQFPDKDVVVYFANPFRASIMTKVIENMKRIAHKRIYVIYKVPRCAEVLNQCGFLQALGELPTWPGEYGAQTWRSTG